MNMMNGYSKIRVNRSSSPSKSRSTDPQPGLTFPSPDPTTKAYHGVVATNKMYGQSPWQSGDHGDEGVGVGGGESFGVVLSRTCSSASQRFSASDQKSHGGILQGVVRRAFSMRKSSSLSEGYWRIHDTADRDGDMVMVQEEEMQQERPPRRKKGRIFRACKRLFGF